MSSSDELRVRDKDFPLKDGVSHINVYSKASTPLGKALTNMSNIPFNYKGTRFSSMEGFYFALSGFLQNIPEFKGKKSEVFKELSSASCFQAKKISKKYIPKNPLSPDDFQKFKDIYKEALICKIEQNEYIKVMLINSDLPFVHYYYFGEKDNAKVIESARFDWMMEILEELRVKFKKD